MNQKAALTLLLMALMLSMCFTASAATTNTFSPLAEAQHLDSLRFSTSVPLVVGAGLQGNTSPLEQPTRQEIYNYITANPGVHFRGICDGLGLSVGVVQYHLDVLEHADKIVGFIDGQNRRYFEAGAYSETQMQLISLVRHETTAKILAILTQNDGVLHRNLACSLGITSQALTWQMNRLKDAGLIHSEQVGVNVQYSVTCPDAIRQALQTIQRTY